MALSIGGAKIFLFFARPGTTAKNGRRRERPTSRVADITRLLSHGVIAAVARGCSPRPSPAAVCIAKNVAAGRIDWDHGTTLSCCHARGRPTAERYPGIRERALAIREEA